MDETQQKQQEEADQKQSSEQVCRFFQNPTKKKTIRKRVREDENEKVPDEGLKGKKAAGDDQKLYKGIRGYTDYKAGFRREQTGGSHGPLRAPAGYIRASTMIDFQLGICKDYKKSGYCGYGDSCKFMHDR